MATQSPSASSTRSAQPRRRFGELLSGRCSPDSVSRASSGAARGSSWTLSPSTCLSAMWRSSYPPEGSDRMRTWPNSRPSETSSTQRAKASRESRAVLGVLFRASEESGGAVRNFVLLALHLAGAGGDQARHRGVSAHRGAVEDGLVAARRHLAAETEVLGNGLTSVPSLGDEDRDQDDVLRLDVLDDFADRRVLIQESYLYDVVEITLPYALSVQVDDPAGVLVQVGAMSEQDERPAARWDLFALKQVLSPLLDHVRHSLEGPQRACIVDRLAAFMGDGTAQSELARYHLLGQVPLRDKGGHHVDILRFYHVENVAHGGLFFPEALHHLVVLITEALSDARRVLVNGQARVL